MCTVTVETKCVYMKTHCKARHHTFQVGLRKVCIKFACHWFLSDLLKLEHKLECMQILERKNEFEQEKNSYSVAFFPPSPLKFRNEGWVKNIGAHLRQAGVKAPIYWENKESGRKYFRPVKQNISVP